MAKEITIDDWRVHTPHLMEEILHNKGTWALVKPLQIFSKILYQVGEVASKINDPELNKLMVRLTIYAIADPTSPDYDQELVDKILNS